MYSDETQVRLFEDTGGKRGIVRYQPVLTVSENGKGVLDVDTVKGCTLGLRAYPDGGCYGECYANKTARRYGIDFSTSVARRFTEITRADTFFAVKRHRAKWYRIGTAGDPCHDWENTLSVCEYLSLSRKIPVIITKHWIALTDQQLARLATLRAVVNTSTSGMDTDAEILHRVQQIERLREAGVRSVCRVVTCSYGESQWARRCAEKQEFLLSLSPIIDNPLRVSQSNARVISREIIVSKRADSIGGGKLVSLHSPTIYLGTCGDCPDQCGVDHADSKEQDEDDNRDRAGWLV